MQHQLEIKYFWPLTEQIELDLDYSNCHKPKIEWSPIDRGLYIIADGSTTNSTITASHLVLDIDTTTVTVKRKPSILSRCVYGIIGLKWKVK
jgi:hypothetical protein